MNHSEVARVLAKVSAFDQRTVGEADVLAWHEVLAGVDLADALAAVTRHYRESTERIMPAHVRRLARVVREDRARLDAKTAPRELPGRFEDDAGRDERLARGAAKVRAVIAPIVAKFSLPKDVS